jgi:type IV pilus assembly protein PilM
MAVAQGVKLKDHAVLALDIGTRFIKVAEMRLARGTISLVNVAVSPTPPGVVDSNQVLDPVGLGRAVKSVLAVNKIRARKAVLAVTGQSSVVVRPIDLPKMSVKELTDTMRFEVERHIPFTADEVVMDYAPIIDPDDLPEEETNMKVLLAVAQEELIKSYLKVLSTAGLQPIALDVEILAAMRALIDIHQRTGQLDNTMALVSIGAVSTDISIINQGNLIFTRSVPIAGDALTEAIADQLGRTPEEAEELKKEYGRIFLELGEPEAYPQADEQAPDGEAEAAQAGGLFDAFGSAAPAAGASAPPLFSLEDDQTTPMAAPAGQSADEAAFEMDDGVDDEVPVFRFGLGEEEERPDVPVFSLDEDNVDDEVPGPSGQQPGLTAAPSTGAVFDLSSELERQLPTYNRPSAQEMPAGPAQEQIPTSLPNMLGTAAVPAGDSAAQMQVPLTESPGEDEEPGDTFFSAADMFGPVGPGDAAQTDIFQRRIFDAMMPTLVELVTEIRRSFEYFTSREPDTPIDRVLIYGGTSRLPYLIDFIQQELGLEVQQADPLVALDLSHFRQPADYLKDVAPALPICIGLGLRDMLA